MTIKRAGHGRLCRLGFVAVVCGVVFAVAGLPMSPAGANDPGPPGNNGTIKIDGVDLDDGPGHSNQPNDPDETNPDNDPHVTCGLQVEFSNFDTGQMADITFTAHPPTGSNGVLSDESFVVISDDGTAGAPNDVDAVFTYDVLTDFDLTRFTSVHDVHGWHVKLDITVYDADGKKVPGAQKHKVFWVDPCEAPCEPTVDNNQCEPPCVPSEANNQCQPPCVPTVDNNQCQPRCVPDASNNQCTPCPTGTPNGQGGCTPPPCVPTVDNNQCTPCPPGLNPTGQGACPPPAPPVDVCPDQPGLQANTDQCVQIDGDSIVAPAVPETPGSPEVPAAMPPTQVAGIVVPRELPKTGTTTLPLLQVGAGLILVGSTLVLLGRKRAALI